MFYIERICYFSWGWVLFLRSAFHGRYSNLFTHWSKIKLLINGLLALASLIGLQLHVLNLGPHTAVDPPGLRQQSHQIGSHEMNHVLTKLLPWQY